MDNQKALLLKSAPQHPLPIPPVLPKGLFRGLCAFFIIFLLLFTGYIGCIFVLGPLLPLTFLAPKLFRKLVDLVLCSWFMLSEFFIAKLMGVRVRQFGDTFDLTSTPRYCLFILNHRTELDWFFAWGLGIQTQLMKIVLKESLACIPGSGWAMQCAAFIFLRRQIATDKRRFDQTISYLLSTSPNCEIFIYPEGTNISEDSLKSSNSFAVKAGLPFVAHTLHPRCTGFVHLVNLLGRERIKYIYDMTIGYPDDIPDPVLKLFTGNAPREVHYHVRRFNVEDLPWLSVEDPEEQDQRLANWLRERWLVKEDLLKSYYARSINERQFADEVPISSYNFQPSSGQTNLVYRFTWMGRFNLLFWFVVITVPMYLLFNSWLAIIYACVVQLIFFYLTHIAGGVTSWAQRFIDYKEFSSPIPKINNKWFPGTKKD